MTLNGWQRLWVGAAVIWTLLMGGLAIVVYVVGTLAEVAIFVLLAWLAPAVCVYVGFREH